MAVDGVDEAAWWLTRWVSGSMRDHDWDDSWCAMDVVGAFEALAGAVGAERSRSRAAMWRYLVLPEAEAAAVAASMLLPVNPDGIFQSFTGTRSVAEDDGPQICGYVPDGEVAVIVEASPADACLMFGTADLEASRHPAVRDALLQLDDWRHQDEILVRVERPLPLRAVEIVGRPGPTPAGR